jgi:hypothetical protein
MLIAEKAAVTLAMSTDNRHWAFQRSISRYTRSTPPVVAGDVKMILCKTRGDAIVDDHTLLTDQYGIAGASHGLLQEPVGIEAIHELGSVGTAELDTTQSADVDHAYARPHRHDLLGHTAQLVIWLTIECGSPPEPCRHPLRAGCIMPVSDRRSPVWMKPSAGYVSRAPRVSPVVAPW